MKRLYAPFVKQNNRWIRAGYLKPLPACTVRDSEAGTISYLPASEVWTEFGAYSQKQAISIYQSWLLASAIGLTDEIRELRPVK